MKRRYFDIAKKLSYKSEYCHRLGAVIVYKNEVIGLGFNKPFKTHPKSNNRFKTIHAELDAILNAGECKGADIYIYRETKDGTLANSKPCVHCQELIRLANIRNIYYTDNGKFEQLLKIGDNNV